MRALAFSLVCGLAAASVSAQPCEHWVENYGINQLNGRIQASIVFDDGTGPALYVAGEFRNNDDTPGRRGVAKWTGSSYVPVGDGLDGSGWSLAVFDDDGAGPNPPALYVGGSFQHAGGQSASAIAKWDGHNWTSLGNGIDGTVYALKTYDDGSGTGLYAAGNFDFAGFNPASSIAVWRNGDWSEVGNGIHFGAGPGIVSTLEVFQGGLYAGGFFDNAGGGVAANSLVKWQGGAWSALGAGVSWGGSAAQVNRLLAVNLPATGGPSLVVAGTMTTAGGVSSGPIARWNGTGWASMNSGAASSSWFTNALAVFDDGSGPAVYAGGLLPQGAGVSKWNGTSWDLVGAVPNTVGVPLGIDTMCVAPGNKLYVGGMFKQIAGNPVPMATFYQGGNWTPADGFGRGLDARINTMGVFDLGDGPKLYAGGSFTSAGGVAAAGVARLSRTGWEALASSMSPNGTVRSLAAFNDGTGMALYVGGAFTQISGVNAANVAKWRPGTGWSAMGAGLSSLSTSTFGAVYSLCVHDDDGAGPHPAALYATGLIQFTGATEVTNVVRWTGSTWASVGTGAGPNGTGGACLASLDLDGPGGQPPRLYFGGVFLPIAVWDGTTWTQDAATPSATVISAIGAFDVGDGMHLYAGGDFTSPFQGSLARKMDSGWENVGNSPLFPNGGGSGGTVEAGCVQSLMMYTDSSGPALYMTGIFGALANNGYVNVAKWNGGVWSGVGSGLASRFPGPDGRGTSLAVFDDGGGPALFVGGKFERFYPSMSDIALNSWHSTYDIAKWGCMAAPHSCCNDFDGDGDVGTDLDINAFFACLGGNCCPTCCGADFNGDGDVGTDADIDSFFRVLSGMPC